MNLSHLRFNYGITTESNDPCEFNGFVMALLSFYWPRYFKRDKMGHLRTIFKIDLQSYTIFVIQLPNIEVVKIKTFFWCFVKQDSSWKMSYELFNLSNWYKDLTSRSCTMLVWVTYFMLCTKNEFHLCYRNQTLTFFKCEIYFICYAKPLLQVFRCWLKDVLNLNFLHGKSHFIFS